jgi:hypothetical protein
MHSSRHARKGKEKAVLLDQILRRQEEYIKSLGPIKKTLTNKPPRSKKKESLVKSTPVHEIPRLITGSLEPTDAELREIEHDSGTFSFDQESLPSPVSVFDKYVPKIKGEKRTHKMVGLPVPLDIHARMLKFIEANKDKPNAPQSLKELGVMCLGYALDSLESSQG